ncbi:bifunctional UDP-4-keto-pentose/UDP-xylose synthase [Cupriavidus phytorum]
MKKVLILGVNGFIGHHLTRRILETTPWEVYGMDMNTDRLGDLVDHPRMHFFEGDITINREWIEYNIRKCDVVLPLVAIATPATYVRQPLRVFELDFEANLPIVRAAVKYRKHLVFPSTSEVYGMCGDEEFDPDASPLVYGPINKPRWIYACSKQLMDRVIHAYGMEQGLNYTLFRPFNWIGAGLDSIFESKEGSSRVVTQFLGHIVRGEPIRLVDGGAQQRAFADIADGISALMRIIENPGGVASGKIYNIGNPGNIHSVRELATQFLGHIVRGEPIRLVDGGAQQRAFADIADGISALMRIIENPGGVASGKIYNIGNPGNIHSVRELAEMMLKMAADYPEYAQQAQHTQIVETSSGDFYGKGYQDVQHRVPKIDNTIEELGWHPEIGMEAALRRIFEAYRGKVVEARTLVDSGN